MPLATPQYGRGDASYRAAGCDDGIARLVDTLYKTVASEGRFSPIFSMHRDDLSQTHDKLARFLCGWLGGPKRHQEKYGSVSIPQVHAHLESGEPERDQWIACMALAIEQQPYEQSFKQYLLEQLDVPARVLVKHSRSRADNSQVDS
ncbi:MAG: hemoglobin [Gammaproteobacteria bacterium]